MSTPNADALRKVKRAARKNEAARAALEDAMRSAREAGHALRPIAVACGLSVEWTRQIVEGTEKKVPE